MSYAEAVAWTAKYPKAINQARDEGSSDASILLREFGKHGAEPTAYYSDVIVASAATDLQVLLGATTYP